MITKDTMLVIIHNEIPCANGFQPTDFKVLKDKLAPIKNNETVNPFFAIATKMP